MESLSIRWRGMMVFLMGTATVFGTIFLEKCADAGHYATLANGMQIHMGCTWTERAILGLGGLVAVVGLLMMIAPPAAQYLSMAAAAAGLLVLATPLWLIPTCPNPMMTCNMSLKPGSLLLGGLVTVAGLVGATRLRRAEGDSTLRRAANAR